MSSITTRWLLILFFVIIAVASPISASNSRKLDETSVPGGTESCGGCSSCQNPCNQSPPPPPPSPPPPSPPSLPPPSPKKPPSNYCPPPPPSGSSLIYITGPPGELYPVDPYYSGADSNFAVGLPVLIGCGLLGLLAFW